MKQMPAEGTKFKQVDGTWREILAQVHAAPKCTTVSKTDRMLERFEDANVLLDQINKGLSAYLETKRLFFSRFFFLSNDELLEILAETKDPTRVQPFLKKCFEGIVGLTFSDTRDIINMTSKEGESVPLTTTINPDDSKGAVEKWLLQLEDEMRRTMKSVCKKAMSDYTTKVSHATSFNPHSTLIQPSFNPTQQSRGPSGCWTGQARS